MKKKSNNNLHKKRPGRVSTLRFRIQNGNWIEFLDARQISEILGVPRQTAYKWISDQQKIDRHRLQLLTILATGFVPFEGWEDWRFDGGRLIGPTRYGFTPGELLNLSYIKSLNGELRREIMERVAEIKQLRAQLAELTQPRPQAKILNLADYHSRPPARKKPGV